MSFLRVITVPAEGNLNSRQSLSKSILRKKLRVAVYGWSICRGCWPDMWERAIYEKEGRKKK